MRAASVLPVPPVPPVLQAPARAAVVRVACRAGLKDPMGLMGLACLACLLATATPARAGDSTRGAELYRQHCAQCHGSSGRPLLPGTPDLSRPTALLRPDPVLLQAIREGRGAMPGYRGQLRDRDILDIVTHLRLLR